MNKLNKLSFVLKGLGFIPESNQILKEATAHGVMTLGYSEPAAKIINEIVGDKWDYIIAKWIFETHNYLQVPSVQDYYPGFSRGGNDDILGNLKAADGCRELMGKTEEHRLFLFKEKVNNKNILNLYQMIPDEKSMNDLLKHREWSAEDLAFFRKDSSPTVDEKLSLRKEGFETRARALINEFISNDFLSDVIANGWKPPAIVKKMSYSDALTKWTNERTTEFPTFLELEDGWRWVDVGGGKSEWVRTKFRNCGSSSWGNLSATPESKKLARMLVLLDPDFEPKVIATWNSALKETDDSGSYKYLSAIEGVASSPVREEHYGYVLKLIDFLQPDLIQIPGKVGEYAGKEINNQNLIKMIDKRKLK